MKEIREQFERGGKVRKEEWDTEKIVELNEVQKKVRDFDQWGTPDKKGGVVGAGVCPELVPRAVAGLEKRRCKRRAEDCWERGPRCRERRGGHRTRRGAVEVVVWKEVCVSSGGKRGQL